MVVVLVVACPARPALYTTRLTLPGPAMQWSVLRLPNVLHLVALPCLIVRSMWITTLLKMLTWMGKGKEGMMSVINLIVGPRLGVP